MALLQGQWLMHNYHSADTHNSIGVKLTMIKSQKIQRQTTHSAANEGVASSFRARLDTSVLLQLQNKTFVVYTEHKL